MSADEDTELRDLVAQTLESNGVLAKIRAQLRASVVLALEEQESVQTKTPFLNQDLKSFINTKEGKLVTCLVQEFLEFFNLEFTQAVFHPESGINEHYEGRSTLADAVNVGDESKSTGPLLCEILHRSRNGTGGRSNLPQETSDLTAAQIADAKEKFAFYDKDNNGSIDKDELRGLFTDMFPAFHQNMLERYVNDEFRSIDKDFSNSIDFDEFLCMYRRLFVQCRSVVAGDANDMIQLPSYARKTNKPATSSNLAPLTSNPKEPHNKLVEQNNRRNRDTKKSDDLFGGDFLQDSLQKDKSDPFGSDFLSERKRPDTFGSDFLSDKKKPDPFDNDLLSDSKTKKSDPFGSDFLSEKKKSDPFADDVLSDPKKPGRRGRENGQSKPSVDPFGSDLEEDPFLDEIPSHDAEEDVLKSTTNKPSADGMADFFGDLPPLASSKTHGDLPALGGRTPPPPSKPEETSFKGPPKGNISLSQTVESIDEYGEDYEDDEFTQSNMSHDQSHDRTHDQSHNRSHDRSGNLSYNQSHNRSHKSQPGNVSHRSNRSDGSIAESICEEVEDDFDDLLNSQSGHDGDVTSDRTISQYDHESGFDYAEDIQLH